MHDFSSCFLLDVVKVKILRDLEVTKCTVKAIFIISRSAVNMTQAQACFCFLIYILHLIFAYLPAQYLNKLRGKLLFYSDIESIISYE